MGAKKPKTPPPDDPAQSERFVETAKAVGATNGNAFARAMELVVPKRKRKRAKA